MASDGRETGKLDLSEENRVDSGIESFKSITKDDHCSKSVYEPITSNTDTRDKLDSVTEERVDSAYRSSSITVESLADIVQVCNISDIHGEESEQSEYSEEEVNLITTITEDGDTILHLAIIHEVEDFAHQLIQLFPKDVLDIQNNLYQTPLHLATYLKLPSVVRCLVEKGASVEIQDQNGNTPLHVACEQGRGECATALTHDLSPSKLAHVLEIQNWRGLSCLHVATMHGHHRLMRLLLKKGVNLNVQEGTSGKTPLHIAVELHNVAAVTMLLNKGANVDAAMFNGCTALHLAVGRQYTTMANLLCQSGADKMIRNIEDETALDLADGNDDILALFPFDDIQIMGRTVGVNL